MRIATWNVNGLRARLDFVLHWLDARRPDLVGLQELKVEDSQFPFAAFEAAGYTATVHGQRSWNGVAVLSRQRVEVVRRGLPGQEALGARLVTVRAGDLQFTTVYGPNGKAVTHADYPRKLVWFDALCRLLAEEHDPAAPVVLCGDLNIVPAPIDSWNEAKLAGGILHTDEERERFSGLTAWGFRDLFRDLHPEERKFSWWDYRGGAFHRKMGLRIDFLLATAIVAQRVRSVEIDREYRKKKDGRIPSDHAPVIADLDEP